MLTQFLWTGAGGDDEFQGLVDYTFTRPDGTQLGTQGKLLVRIRSQYLERSQFVLFSSLRVAARLYEKPLCSIRKILISYLIDPQGFRDVLPRFSILGNVVSHYGI